MNIFSRFSLCAMLAAGIVIFHGTASAQWADDFESYTDGQVLDGLGGDDGGWGGWDMNPAFAATVSSLQARSGTQSILIGPTTDAVRPFVGEYVSGRVELQAWMYLPSATFLADTYFIVNNAYDGTGVGYSWTTQMHFQTADNMIVCESEGGGGTAAIVFDAWAEIRIIYDLDNDVQLTFYEGALISTGAVDPSGPYEIANIDLFSTGATNFFDDLSLTPCTAGDINGDGNVDLLDVTPFVNLLSGGGGYSCAADINLDGAVDLLDVTPFVNLLSGG